MVWLYAAVGAEGLGGARQGSFGGGGDGGPAKGDVRAVNAVTRCRDEVRQVGDVGCCAGGVAAAEVREYVRRGAGVGYLLARRGPEGPEECERRLQGGGHPAPKEVHEGGEAWDCAFWGQAPTDVASAAHIRECLQGLHCGNQRAVWGGRGEDVR